MCLLKLLLYFCAATAFLAWYTTYIYSRFSPSFHFQDFPSYLAAESLFFLSICLCLELDFLGRRRRAQTSLPVFFTSTKHHQTKCKKGKTSCTQLVYEWAEQLLKKPGEKWRIPCSLCVCHIDSYCCVFKEIKVTEIEDSELCCVKEKKKNPHEVN